MNRKIGSVLLAGALLALPLLALSPGERAFAAADMAVKVGQKAPDFSLKALDGKTFTLSDYAGKKVVMLDFWATWCGVCKDEMPELVKVYSELRPLGFEMFGVTLQTGLVSEVQDVADRYKLNYPVLLDESLVVATKLYKLAGPIPLKVVIDGNGIVKYTHVGDYPPGENEIPDVVRDLIKETIPPPVNLNTAEKEALEKTLRISGSLADTVVKGRPYKSVDDLAKIKEFPLDMVKHLLFVKP